MVDLNNIQGVARGIAKIRENFNAQAPPPPKHTVAESILMTIARFIPTALVVLFAAFFIFMQRYFTTVVFGGVALVVYAVTYLAATSARCIAVAAVALCAFLIPMEGFFDDKIDYNVAKFSLLAIVLLGLVIDWFTNRNAANRLEQNKLSELESKFSSDYNQDVPIYALMSKQASSALFVQPKDEYANLQPLLRVPIVFLLLFLAAFLTNADPRVHGTTGDGFCEPERSCSIERGVGPTIYEPCDGGVKLARWEVLETNDAAELKVVVPGEYEGQKVVAIGQAFSGNDSIVSVTLPDTIETIDSYAFAECKNLVDVQLSSRLTTLPSGLFFNCSKLTEINVPESVTEIQNRCFYGCGALKNVVLQEKLTSIAAYAFTHCNSLQKIDLPDSLLELHAYAFAYSNIQSIKIPQNVTTLKEGCFYSCANLAFVDLPENLKKISEYVFYECGSLESISLPANLERIGPCAFSRSGLTTVAIPGKTGAVRERCFAECPHLTEVVMEPGVTRVGARAFYDCPCLSRVKASWTMKYFGSSSFRACPQLKQKEWPFYVATEPRTFKKSR